MYRVEIIFYCWMLLFTEAAPNQNTQANLDSPNAVEGETIIEQMSPTGTIYFSALNNPIVCVNATCIFTEKGNLSTMLNKKKSYRLFSDFKVDFVGALHWCVKFGMKLASIESSEENEIFTAAFLKHNRRNDNHYYIAGRRTSNTAKFNWISSGEDITYFNWDPNQPTNGALDLCLLISSYTVGLWHDDNCANSRYFVCEK